MDKEYKLDLKLCSGNKVMFEMFLPATGRQNGNDLELYSECNKKYLNSEEQ